MPVQLVIIRHAEKPDDDSRSDLSHRGQIRAAALAVYLPGRFGYPGRLIAAKGSRESNRPLLTLTPLGQSLGLPIDTRFKDDEYKDLARELLGIGRNDDEPVVICWHHGTIPELARALGVGDAPDHWDDHEFDRIWQIDGFPDAPSLTRHHQKLLYGDRD